MATSRMSEVIRRLRVTAQRGGPGMTDGQLLECFVGQRDEAAFAALVRRHGPMVWGVCRRVLHSHHDAEDAFQATFLVLVRRAGSVVPRQRVANWLYGVARQTAVKARALAARRSGRERLVMELPEPVARDQVADHDLRSLLDRELSQLPARYRVAIVLCDLEQKTRREVARQLDVPEGTLSGLLTRGRRMLAKRLSRQGLALSGGVLPLLLAQEAASGCLPAAVVSTTIETATLVAAGLATAGTLTPRVAALTQGVLKAMLWNKLRPGIALLFVLLGTLGLVAAIGARPAPADGTEPQSPTTMPPATESRNTTPPADKQGVTTEEYYQYALEFTLVEVDPDGRDLGADGKGKVMATPKTSVREGKEASFFIGQERPVALGINQKTIPLTVGLSVRVKPERLSDGTITLDSSLESSVFRVTGATRVQAAEDGTTYLDSSKAQVDTAICRRISAVKLGESVKLEVADARGGNRYWVRIKVTEEEWVRRSSRRRSG